MRIYIHGNHQWYIGQKTIIYKTLRLSNTNRVNSGAPEGLSVLAPLVVPVRVTFIKSLVISHEQGKDWEFITTNVASKQIHKQNHDHNFVSNIFISNRDFPLSVIWRQRKKKCINLSLYSNDLSFFPTYQ